MLNMRVLAVSRGEAVEDFEAGYLVEEFTAALEPREFVEFVTKRDDRVDEMCRPLDGFIWRRIRFPKTYIPPLHFGCRCSLRGFKSTIKDVEERLQKRPPRVFTRQPG